MSTRNEVDPANRAQIRNKVDPEALAGTLQALQQQVKQLAQEAVVNHKRLDRCESEISDPFKGLRPRLEQLQKALKDGSTNRNQLASQIDLVQQQMYTVLSIVQHSVEDAEIDIGRLYEAGDYSRRMGAKAQSIALMDNAISVAQLSEQMKTLAQQYANSQMATDALLNRTIKAMSKQADTVDRHLHTIADLVKRDALLAQQAATKVQNTKESAKKQVDTYLTQVKADCA